MSSSGLVASFLGALQASVAVLLTVFYGVIAAQYELMSESSAKDISKTCVRMFLPALLIHNVGSQLHLDTATKYIPVLLWSITYNVLSMVMGVVATKLFKMPTWVSPAIAFNNTTSLPLLLIQSLETTGLLSTLLKSGSDTPSDAVTRAKSYFLINAMVSNTLTFAMGPRLLDGQAEDAPDKNDKDDDDSGNDDEEQGEAGNRENGHEQDENGPNEHTSLLPDQINDHVDRVRTKAKNVTQPRWNNLDPRVQRGLIFLYQFWNAPLIGALIGAILGLVPSLHRAFFNDTQKGGFFNAWLMSSVKNIGDLFASLQVIVVGVKLSQSMRKMKEGKASGSVPWAPFVFISFIRYLIWPVISISLIWVLASKTNVLSNDPILWFCMMLMPAGPPAMKLTALADVNGSPEEEKMSIAKFLALAYSISPLICFSVVGSLKASEAIVGS